MKSFVIVLGLFISVCFSGVAQNYLSKTPLEGEFTDLRDNHTYTIVQIGSQVWFAQNFGYMPYICHPDSSNCGITVYNYLGQDINEAKATPEFEKFGCLYSWSAAKELAPEGWHLPSDEEWIELERTLGIGELDYQQKIWRGTNNEVKEIKSGGSTGFNVVFGGWKTDFGKFNFLNEHANFWCSTEFDEGRAYERLIGLKNPKIGRDKGNKRCGFSIRYIKNKD